MIDGEGRALSALRVLLEFGELTERTIAIELGLYPGKAHYALYSLMDRGLVQRRQDQRDRKARGRYVWHYKLTPRGVEYLEANT